MSMNKYRVCMGLKMGFCEGSGMQSCLITIFLVSVK